MPNIIRAYGWRPSLPDHRDFVYAIPPAAVAYPAKFDLNSPPMGPPFNPAWNQGSLGSCGPHAMAENIVYTGMTDLAPGVVVMPSRLFLYYNTRSLMGTTNSDSGVDNRTMCQALQRYGWCDEATWPYDIGNFTVQPPQACYDQADQFIQPILYQSVPQSLNSMKSVLYDLKRPIIFGFTVYASMETPAVDSTGDIPMPNGRTDRVMGGHDVLLTGWDDNTQRFILKNSWGSNWGKNGNGSIPMSYATNPDLAGDFWVVTRVAYEPTPGTTTTTGQPIATTMPPTPTTRPPAPTTQPPVPTTAPPTPTPTTPAPGPGPIQKQIDAIFAGLLAQVTNPWVRRAIVMCQYLVDQYIVQNNLGAAFPSVVSGDELTGIVDIIFAALEAEMAGRPVIIMMLQFVNTMIDHYIVAHGL